MPLPSDRTSVSELRGLSRPLLAFADLAHLDIPMVIAMTIVLAVLVALILTWRRGRAEATSASVNGSRLSQEEGLGHVRRVKAELKGRKAYAGTVRGGIGDRHWVQHLRDGRVRTAFLNPLLQNHRHVRAVREVAGAGVAVDGLVVSAGSARFCGELGVAVVKLEDLAVRMHAMRPPAWACSPAPGLDAAWRALTTAASRSMELGATHEEQMRRRRGGGG